MTPDDVERLLAGSGPVPMPDRIRQTVLAAATERLAQQRDLRRFARLAAAATVLWAVILIATRNAEPVMPIAHTRPIVVAIPRVPNLPMDLRMRIAAIASAPTRAAEPPPIHVPWSLLPPNMRVSASRSLP